MRDIASFQKFPDFNESPYDLGSFDEIIHNRSVKKNHAETFTAGFQVNLNSPIYREKQSTTNTCSYHFKVVFERKENVPGPKEISIESDGVAITFQIAKETSRTLEQIQLGTKRGRWAIKIKKSLRDFFTTTAPFNLIFRMVTYPGSPLKALPLNNSKKITERDLDKAEDLFNAFKNNL